MEMTVNMRILIKERPRIEETAHLMFLVIDDEAQNESDLCSNFEA